MLVAEQRVGLVPLEAEADDSRPTVLAPLPDCVMLEPELDPEPDTGVALDDGF